MNRVSLFLSVIAAFGFLSLTIVGQSHAAPEQPISNTFLSIAYYDIGQSFTAEADSDGYQLVWAAVDPSLGSDDVTMTLKLNDTVLASGSSSVDADGIISLDVSGVSFLTGTSYDLYLDSLDRFAKVHWEGYGELGDVYPGGQLITKQGYVEQPPYGNRPLSEYDLAFGVLVPEPGTFSLLGLGLVGLVRCRTRRDFGE